MTIPKAPAYELSIKDALVVAGLLDKSKAGRGKPSRQMQDQADMLVRDHGYKIKGRAVSSTPASASTPAPVERVKVTTGKVITDIGDPIRREDEWRAFATDAEGNEVEVGMRQVDNITGNSLTYSFAPVPKVWVDHNHESEVHFRLRSTMKEAK